LVTVTVGYSWLQLQLVAVDYSYSWLQLQLVTDTVIVTRDVGGRRGCREAQGIYGATEDVGGHRGFRGPQRM
jgi:hypothetical protein